MSKCTICAVELKVTKTCTEIKQHAENKHGKTIEEVFPDALPAAEEMNAARAAPAAAPGPTKKEKKKVRASQPPICLSLYLGFAIHVYIYCVVLSRYFILTHRFVTPFLLLCLS